MAIAWSVVINKVTVFGDQRVVYATLTSPASGSDTYTTGGDTVAPSAVGLDVIDFVNITGVAEPTALTTGYIVNIIPGVGSAANMKVQLFATGGSSGAALAELGSSTAVASFSFEGQFFGV